MREDVHDTLLSESHACGSEELAYRQLVDAKDLALVLLAKQQDQAALSTLIVRYQPIAHKIAKGYDVAGLELDDLAQEALLGLVKAVRSFDPDYQVPFGAYALLCMKRQMQSVVKAGLAGKQRPLRDYLPLEEIAGFTMYVPGDSRTISPESLLIQDEEALHWGQLVQSLLSTFEYEILGLYLSGRSYEEMALQLHINTKAVDNALQRVKRKLRSVRR